MKLPSWMKEPKPQVVKILIFLLVAVAISFLIPLKRSSRYQYTKYKPWQGALLTAPYDFPIYKTDEQLKRERDSIALEQKPVYSHLQDVGMLMMQEFQDEYQARMSEHIPNDYFSYVNKQLQEAYERGVLSLDNLTKLRKEGKLEVLLLGIDNKLERTPITKFRTLGEIHDDIIRGAPKTLDAEVLHKMDVDRFLKENVVYNADMTKQLEREALSNISSSIDMIQMGQRIIDKGEIVTPDIYSILHSLEIEKEKRAGGNLLHYQTRIGLFIVTSLALILLALYLTYLIRGYQPSAKNNGLILTSVFLFVLITSLTSYWGVFNVYMIPYVMIVILLRIFTNGYTSLLTFVVTILLCAFFVVDPLSFVVIQMLAGLTALVSLQNLTSRGKMIRAAFMVYLIYSIAYLACFLVTDGEFTREYLTIQLVFGVNLIFLNFTYLLSDIVEKAFGYVSNASLVELSDINTPLLRELSEIAPGTFQHSIQVSILAADATDRIGGDVQLIRAGALYHDIGKIKNPAYFTENQGELNPHDLLPHRDSAAIIIRHVTDGIALAQKYNLPNTIIDFIRTHHSDSLVRYFYNAYCNQQPEEDVDIADFSYLGPKPFTKEQGILMLADATEASSRSLKEYTVEHIVEHVNRIVDGIIREGHLNDTPLSFRDIQIIKEVFVSKLKTMYHTRISYPELKE